LLAGVLGVTMPAGIPALGPLHAAEEPSELVLAGPAPGLREATDAALAGFPAGSRTVPITWERAYALALEAGGAPAPERGRNLAEVVDAEELRARLERLGPPDFGRLRAGFFTTGEGDARGAAGKFRDPAGNVFEVLRRLQTVENTRAEVTRLEGLMAVIREKNQGESSGLNQLDLDQVEAALQRTRIGLVGGLRHYRDGLDELKAALGLAPGAPVVPDRGSLKVFRDGFAAIEEWNRDPQRVLVDLPRLVSRLPAPGEVVIDGGPVLGPLDRTQDRLESVLAAAVRGARQNAERAARGQPRDPAAAALEERRIRGRLRALIESRQAYLLRQRSLVLAVRSRDQAFERVVAPPSPAPGAPRSPSVGDLLDQQGEVLRVQNDLVAIWAAFQRERLALYRDLGTLPCPDWESFHELLSARPGGDGPAPPLAPPATGAAPRPTNAPPPPGA
jgi:hypothetical protein